MRDCYFRGTGRSTAFQFRGKNQYLQKKGFRGAKTSIIPTKYGLLAKENTT